MMRSISLTKSQNVTAAALIREPFGMLADDSFQSACCEDAAIIVELLSISLCTKNDFRRGYVEKSYAAHRSDRDTHIFLKRGKVSSLS
ncbi:uncharacterized protein PHALS_11885 [Plasmopara halstedii]|uniref:Uncharacterized protein n=1 Tax=Plasmopara halstedii TaxID=4781 RepID=A0A0P1AJN3_PLAHL|nr:uncharacterized protein PHALS_11885 [Plasmopara halstedii]CEG41546.1 hypothetical protein PHALS_11885 [Plasmopara halstedii]|eukprot:XP_024577915.1 hypothetical protein PHALS_11885 [Plasmopara halstedii]